MKLFAYKKKLAFCISAYVFFLSKNTKSDNLSIEKLRKPMHI